jgi:hypothetical protein
VNNCGAVQTAPHNYSERGQMSQDKRRIGDNQHPIEETINKAKRSFGNLFAHDEGIDDEYYINEIIGIDDERYIKEKEDKKKRETQDEIPF